MAIDRYTKMVLTIIAVCLLILTLKELAVIPDALAQSRTTHVLIAWIDLADGATSVSQEFYSRDACITAGRGLEGVLGRYRLGSHDLGWNSICAPKGQ